MISKTKPGFALWLIGLPASGKTTITTELAHGLVQQDTHSQLLDSDKMRQQLTPDPIYSQAEREQFYGRWSTSPSY